MKVIHYEETNSVEATWTDVNGAPTRCHSYDERQMDMLRADLGEIAQEYADLILRVEANIKPLQPRDYTAAKTRCLATFRALREQVFGRLNGIQLDNINDGAMVSAILACKQALKDAPAHASVTALFQDAQATDEQVEDALQTLYLGAAQALYQASPYAYTAFRSLDQ